MTKIKIGKELEVEPIGLGCMGFSHAYGRALDEKTSIKTIRQSYDLGYDFFDTAWVYKGEIDGKTSYNEELVGAALKEVRDDVVIATKFGVAHGDGILLADSREESIRKSVEDSLRRLKTDYIDLYYQHRIDPKVEPEEVAEVMADLINEGKIRAWGISEADGKYIKRAHEVCPVAAIQNRYSMLARDYESLFPLLDELDIAFVAFSPLGNGFLTGKYDENSKFDKDLDFRATMPQFKKEAYEAAADLRKLLIKMGEKYSASPAQISLAWLIKKYRKMIAIPGSRKLGRIEENFRSKDIEIDSTDIDKIDQLLDKAEIPAYLGKKTK